MNILVTGGAGFIGSQIVDALCDQGHAVTVIDSLDPGVWQQPPAYLRDDVRYIIRDLRYGVPVDALRDTEVVIHLAALGGVGRAAKEPANILEGNIGGTAKLIEAMAEWPKLQRVFLAGSFSVYGANYQYRVPSTGKILTADRRKADLVAGKFEIYDETTGEAAEILPITEAAQPNPLETYGASKYMQELCFRGFTSAPVTILRFSSVYGLRLRLDDGEATIIAKLLGSIQRGLAPELFEDGHQSRDWVYVGDIVALITRLVDGLSAPPMVNVCSGTPTTLLEACQLVNEVCGSSVTPRIVGGFRPGDMRHCLGDATLFAALLGRAPTPFRAGVPHLVSPDPA
ncbi:NAD-dependent epimerase/dehydratase family protein [Candidatus Berkelbacteria bacterium]|nr:NAD-dependent epimerase/dehydratase family protein [Candidatus Berkelbacteria bacterium]